MVTLAANSAPAANFFLHKQVIKNITNVAGCRDTSCRTTKSKEIRGMIEHNSEVYNHPYIFFSLYMYVWKEISVRGSL